MAYPVSTRSVGPLWMANSPRSKALPGNALLARLCLVRGHTVAQGGGASTSVRSQEDQGNEEKYDYKFTLPNGESRPVGPERGGLARSK
jgi:hypothetical protein